MGHGDNRPPGLPGDDELRHLITRQLAEMCGVPPSEVDPDRPLDEHGLSSRDTVGLAGYLEMILGRPLPPTLVWEYPTINGLVSALASPAFAEEGEPPAPAPATAEASIAVVGIGCRFPGGRAGSLHGPGAFWDFLVRGGDGVTEVPAGRWEAFDDGSPAAGAALASVTRHAGVLDDVAGFDAAFFGIPPAEADAMDPQQRILLEVCWESLEQAGLPPRSLRGSRTGVFVGIAATEYAHLTTSDLGRIDAWTATGAAGSVAAGRISYLLDLRGPSLAVDTACSSSLLAVHLAVASLRSAESDLALAGGVNLLLSPMITMTFDAGGGTSPDGRCRPFDAAANGMVRGEGCGVVVLKRLADAMRDHDRVLAVITGTAANSDGRSNGLVAPNGTAQRDLLRAAHGSPGQVDYVEAHGTGTPLGDPIEARALGEVLGPGRPAHRPLLIGSVKSNLGHLEAAAGIAGLIKAVLALHHRQIPATLHFTAPSPHISGLPLDIVSRLTPWPENGWAPTAGVSAFGFSGTNVHVVVTAPPGETSNDTGPAGPDPVATTAASCPMLFSLTDVSAERIAGQARALADWLGRPGAGEPLERVAGTLGERAGRGPHRAIVTAGDRERLSAALRALAAGEPHPAVVPGLDIQPGPGVAFVFSGYGSHWAGMGQALAAAEPVFASALAELEAPLRDAAGFSLRQVTADAAALRQAEHAQPAIFALQVALARTWEAHGIRAAAVIGHSMGEVAAAVVSGALTVADGARVIACRSRLLSRLAGAGAMALIGLGAGEVTALGADLPGVHLAVISSPVQCVVTGDAGQVAELARRAAEGGAAARVLQAEGAGHSPQVDPLLGELTEQLAGLDPRLPGIRFYGTALDDPRTPPACDPAYWAANMRRPVRLAPAVAAAAQDGLRAFAEISPHPMLARALAETVRHETGGPGVVTGTLRRDAADALAFHGQIARLAAGGVRLPQRRRDMIIDLPPAPWRHAPHWAAPAPRPAAPGHPLLGPHVELPGGGHAWACTVAAETFPGAAVLGLAAAGEMAVAAACEVWDAAATEVSVSGLRLDHLVPVPVGTVLTTTLDERGDRGSIRVHSREPGGRWMLAATAQAALTGAGDFDELRMAPGRSTARDTVITVPADDGRARGQRIPASVLGACLAAAATAPGQIPVAADLLRVRGPAAGGGTCTLRRDPGPERGGAEGRDAVGGGGADLWLAAGPGAAAAPLLEVRGVRVREVPVPPVPYAGKLFEVTWEPRALPPPRDAAPRHWVVLGGGGGDTAPAGHRAAARDPAAPDLLARDLTARLRDAGHRADLAASTSRYSDIGVSDIGMSDGGTPGGVVLIMPPGPLDPAEAQWAVLDAIQCAASLAGAAAGPSPRLWIVTAGALAVRPGEAGQPGPAAVAGLVRVLALERPALRATLVDLAPDAIAGAGADTGPDAGLDSGAGPAADAGAAPSRTANHDRGESAYKLLWVTPPRSRTGAGEGAGGQAPGPDAARGADAGSTPGEPGPSDGPDAGAGLGSAVAALAAELIADAPDDEVAWRDGTRLVARLARAPAIPAGSRRPVVRPGGSYIITGGYGGLGLLVARWLAGQGASRVVLSGRSGPPDRARGALAELGGSGTQIVIVTGDVAEPGVAEQLVAAAQEGGTPLRGVVHAAGVFADALIGDVTPADLGRVWAPKAAGAWRLHEATAGADLDWFVLFSSAASLLGSPGQAAYATANAWLDAFARWRRAAGLPAVAVNWGVWADAGAAAGVVLGGIGPIGPDEGITALEALLAERRTAVGVVRIDPAAAAAAYPEIAAMPYFSPLIDAADQPGAAGWAGAGALRAAEPARRRQMAGQRAQAQVAAVLGLAADMLPASLPLTDAGMDSLAAQRICNLLEHDLGVVLEPAALLGGVTLAQLQESLTEALGAGGNGGPGTRNSAPASPGTLASPGTPGTSEFPAPVTPVVSTFAPSTSVTPSAAQVAGASRATTRPPGVEPRDAAERLVTRVVADVLGTAAPPGVTDDLAGALHGPALAEIGARLAGETGTRVDAAVVFAVPTIEAAAEHLRVAEDAEAGQLIRPISPGGPNPPVLLAHPAGGTTGVYKALASLLGGSRPVFGLERLDGPVRDRAARYAREILERFGGGGWVIGGWSFGGVLGYETARQLREAGHRAELVVLLDAALPLPVSQGGEGEALARRFAAFAGYLERTYGLTVGVAAEELLGLDEDAQLGLLMERMARAGLADVLSPAILRHQIQSHEDTRALEQYEPADYAGPAVLYRTEQETPWAVHDPRYQITSETRGWGPFCTGLTVVGVAAHHLNLLDPPAVHAVAAHLRTLISAPDSHSQGGHP